MLGGYPQCHELALTPVLSALPSKAKDDVHEGKWTWTDGSPVMKSKWSRGEPKKSGDCAVVNYGKGKWDDDNCSKKKPFHCQVI